MAKSEEKYQDNIKHCFIITPIGESNSEVNHKAFGLIRAVMKPVLEKFNYKPLAASDISLPGSINKQIIIHLYEDNLVIANLTGLNPNVMYELAVRHAVRKPVIIMAEVGTKLPFDLVDQRCIFYEDSLHGVELAKEQLESFLGSALSEAELTNPIYDSINEQSVLKHIKTSDDPSQYLISRLDRIERLLNNQSSEGQVGTYRSKKFTIIVTGETDKHFSDDDIDNIFKLFRNFVTTIIPIDVSATSLENKIYISLDNCDLLTAKNFASLLNEKGYDARVSRSSAN